MILILFAGLVVACSDARPDGSSERPPLTRGGSNEPVSILNEPVSILDEELPGLIFWEDFFYARNNAAPQRLLQVVEALGASEDDRYKAFLVDLGFYPTPFTDQALQMLLGRKGPFSVDEILRMVEDRGFKRPKDDPPFYVEFKQRLITTIDRDVAAFIEPSQPRTISAQEVHWGGVRVDGIPPLNEPAFVSAEAATRWIRNDDFVIGVELNDDAKAYPRRIIDWHEMVNDTIGGIPVSLAYCTLCGSAILYDARFGAEVYRFGTSGLLYRSNKLMYDRTTRSLWEQFTGEPVWGPLTGRGIRLEALPVVHTTWGEWVSAHPDTRVLDIETGFRRNYGSVEGAGVAYAEYWMSPDLIFPAPDRSGPLSRKDYVYVVRIGQELTAYPVILLSKKQIIQDSIADQRVVVIATEDGSGGRAYRRESVDFVSADLTGGVLRSRDGKQWQITEPALIGPDGSRLERLPGHNSFWFAILNHAPLGWRLYED